MKKIFKRLLVASFAVGLMSFSPIILSENNLQIVSVAYAAKDSEILESAEDNELPENETSEQVDNKTPAQQKLDEGNELYDQKNYQDAISKYDEVIQIDPNYAETYNGRGLCQKELGENEKADADFAKAKGLGYDGGKKF